MSKHTKEPYKLDLMGKSYLNNARQHIKDKHNGEMPYSYGINECARLMQSYADQETQSLRTKIESLRTWIIETTVNVEGQDGTKWNCIERDEILQQLNER